jgi:hypothetical protein
MFAKTVAQALKGLEKSLRDLAEAEEHHSARAGTFFNHAASLRNEAVSIDEVAFDETKLAERASRARSKLADLIG